LAGLLLAALLVHAGTVTASPGDPPANPSLSPPVSDAPPVYCPVCGARNRAGSRFCLKDGSELPPLDPARFNAGFKRALETYPQEEIQAAVHRASASVVRIRGQTNVEMRYPVLVRESRSPYLYGRVEVMKGEERFAGSGFCVGGTGEIVTNAHVASPYGTETRLVVETPDGRSLPARLLGIDRAVDVALLKVETGAIPPLEWGDSNEARIGEEVWAVGNPLDLGITLTRGTLSSLGRVRVGLNQIESFLHTDAFITHGNSGGPLVDVLGRVLGVNDATVLQPRHHGYAIPSLTARLAIERIRKAGRYDRGYLGLHLRPIDADAISRYAITRRDGVLVEWILPASPAAGAGLRQGDVVFGINGRRAPTSYLLQEAVSSIGPGKPVTLSVERGGQAIEVKATTASRPEDPRTDPLVEWQRGVDLRFEADAKTGEVLVRIPGSFSQALKYGFKDGDRLVSVLPAQNWIEETIDRTAYKTKAHPVAIAGLEDLRKALTRSHLGQRLGAIFLVKDTDAPLVAVVFDEALPVIL
jgi:serine protease Do